MKRAFLSYAKYSFTAIWLFMLIESTSYYMPYFVVGMGSIYCVHKIDFGRISLTNHERACIALGSVLFAAAVSLANGDTVDGILWMGVLFLTGYGTIRPVFVHLVKNRPSSGPDKKEPCPYRASRVFAVCFAVIFTVDVFVLFTTSYPGVLSPDSLSQITQFLTGEYSNHHPFYHTQIIRLLYNMGLFLFKTPNEAVAFYSVCQIIAMAAVFSYTLTTLYQRNRQLGWVILGLSWYVLMPFHVMYSFSVWKDVLWSGMITVYIVSMYRLFLDMGRKRVNEALIILSSMGICLLRSNGMFAYTVLTVLFAVFYRKKYPRILVIMVCAMTASWILKHPVLEFLGVVQPDVIESLSIPAQQIARVIADGNVISEEHYHLLSQVVDVERIPETYRDYISDNIKDLVRETNNQSCISENKGSFLKLWIEMGIQYPASYVNSWIDQTKGYWNGGYDYWVFLEYIHDNSLNIFRPNFFPEVRNALSLYGGKFYTPFLCIFISIGFHVWLAAGIFVVSLARKRINEAFLCMPVLAVVASLMIATPVFSEFRYAYCVFTSMPLILALLGENETLCT